MRFTVRLYLYWVSVLFTFFVGVVLVVYLLWGTKGNLLQLGLVFFIVGIIPPAIITLFFAKRLDYMESDDLAPPSFSGQKMERFHFKGRTQQPFDEVLQRIDRQWIISYSNRKEGVLKFRTDARMAAWGLGGYVKMEDKETVLVIVYPVQHRSQREKQMVDQLLLLVKSVLGCGDNIQFILAAHST